MQTPYDKYVITTKYQSSHPAIDMYSQSGSAVHSCLPGKVYFVYRFNPSLPLTGNNRGGNFVIIQTGDLWVYYGHLSSIMVSVGQSVLEGQVIGTEGATGEVTGAHLHWEVHKGTTWEQGINIDPFSLTGGTMDYKAEYENLLRWKKEVETWSNGVQASHVDPTLKILGETAFLTKPFSEKIKVVSDYAKQVPGLKEQINTQFIPVGQLYVKKG